ncbi:MAG: hypothetical protein ABIO06_11345 [Pseudolysinimonas sp.]
MIKRITAALVAVALGLGLSLVAVSAAQAHTGDLNATAVCQDNGTYLVTYKLTISNTSEAGTTKWSIGTSSFAHTPTSNADLPGTVQPGTVASTGAGAYVLGTTTVPGSTTTAPWAYAYTTWVPDNFSKGSDGGDISLAGTCGDTPDSKKITFCHYDSGQGGKYTLNTTSVAAFYTAGHINHPNDIFPAGSVTKQGVTHTWAAQGDQSLLNWDKCVAIDAAAAIAVTTPSCQSASVATWSGLLNATGGAIDASVGTHSAVATATNNHQFPAGAGVSADGKTKTISYTITGATSGSPCWPADASAGVTLTQPTCSTGATAAATAGTFIADVQTSGQTSGPGTETFVFTATSGHKFPAGAGVSNDGSTLTISQALAGPDTSLCPTLVPSAPVVKDLCETSNDHYGLPIGPAGVSYSRSGLDIIATITAADTFWGTLPAGWVLNGDGTATYAFTNTTWTNVDCYPPVSCTLSGTSDTESGDLAPVQGLDGLIFDGPTAVGQAKDIYYRVLSGNAQGISGIGYTVAPGSNGFTAQIVIEVDPNTDLSATPGVNHYATLTAVVSGSGVFTNLETQAIWYTNKIAYGDAGGQGNPITYAALVALMPANTLLSAPSLHLQSNSPADAHSVVSSLTSSCGTFSYGLIHVPSSVSHTNQSCNVDSQLVGGVITVGITEHVTYSIVDSTSTTVPFNSVSGKTGELTPGTYTVTATPDSGYGLDPDISGDVVISAYGDDCGHVDASVSPGATPHNQYCNTDAKPAALVNGYITVNVTPGIDYVVTNASNTVIPFNPLTGDTALLPVGDYTVAPTAQAGFVLVPPGNIALQIAAYTGVDCFQEHTSPLVDPSAVQVQLGCSTAGSYTLSNNQSDPTAVIWTVNGSTVAQSTYSVVTPSTVVVHAAAHGPAFGLETGATTDWTFHFAFPATCDLKTLALTGNAPGGIMVLAGFMLLFGLVLVRRSIRLRTTARS